MVTSPKDPCPETWDLFNYRNARSDGIYERIFLETKVDVGCYYTLDNRVQQSDAELNFFDHQGHEIFKIVQQSQPFSSGSPRVDRSLACCSLLDSAGQQIVVLEHRQAKFSSVKVKSPGGQRLFELERELIGGLKCHFDGMGIANVLPLDARAMNGVIITASYQIDVLQGADSSLCALFIYLIHQAELRNLARYLQKFSAAESAVDACYSGVSSLVGEAELGVHWYKSPRYLESEVYKSVSIQQCTKTADTAQRHLAFRLVRSASQQLSFAYQQTQIPKGYRSLLVF